MRKVKVMIRSYGTGFMKHSHRRAQEELVVARTEEEVVTWDITMARRECCRENYEAVRKRHRSVLRSWLSFLLQDKSVKLGQGWNWAIGNKAIYGSIKTVKEEELTDMLLRNSGLPCTAS